MTENLKKLLEETGKNEELKAKLAALTDRDTAVEQTIGIAKEYGIDLTAEDFQPDEDSELSLDELEDVAGGRFGCDFLYGSGNNDCTCFVIGAESTCGCFFVGVN